jgi:hypothetical protein
MHTARSIMPFLILAATAGHALAQGMPTSQPGILTIIIEEVKVGMDADHEANEAGWPAAFAKAGSQYYYMSLESMTGSPEVWFVSPYASFAAEGENMKQNESNPALSAELARLWRADAPYLNSTRTIQAIARPDLSYGAFPDLAMVRFYDITLMRARLGHELAFENAAKLYMEQVKRAAPGMSYRIYQVISGMPAGHYLIMSTANDYAEYDKAMATERGMWEKVSPKDQAMLQQTMANDVMSVIANRYRVSPTMSYVSPETKAKAPAFWK